MATKSDSPVFRVEGTLGKPGELRIKLIGHRGEFLTLWLPENIWRDLPGRKELPRPQRGPAAYRANAVFGMDSSKEWQETPWDRTEEGEVFRTVQFTDGFVSASAIAVRNELLLRVMITNATSQTWLDCWAEVCLRLAPSPSFADTLRERTLGRIDGKWTFLSSLPLAKPNPAQNMYIATPAIPFVERCLGDWWCAEFPVQLDHPLIAVHNRDDSAVIGVLFDPCAGYCNCLKPDMACIHSDPLLGNIEPGETKTALGKLVYVEGSVQEFLEKASAMSVSTSRKATAPPSNRSTARGRSRGGGWRRVTSAGPPMRPARSPQT